MIATNRFEFYHFNLGATAQLVLVISCASIAILLVLRTIELRMVEYLLSAPQSGYDRQRFNELISKSIVK